MSEGRRPLSDAGPLVDLLGHWPRMGPPPG